MKKVLELLEIVEVPEDYIQCSVCGKFHPYDSYKKPEEKQRSRTNCKTCYEMPHVDMMDLKEKTQTVLKSREYYNKSMKLRNELMVSSNAITKQELIEKAKAYVESLNELPDDALFTDVHEYNDIYFETPKFPRHVKANGNYPCDYPREIDGKPIYFTLL